MLNWEATGIGRKAGLSRRPRGRCPPWRPSHQGCPRAWGAALRPGSPVCPPGPDPPPLPGFPCWKQFICWGLCRCHLPVMLLVPAQPARAPLASPIPSGLDLLRGSCPHLQCGKLPPANPTSRVQSHPASRGLLGWERGCGDQPGRWLGPRRIRGAVLGEVRTKALSTHRQCCAGTNPAFPVKTSCCEHTCPGKLLAGAGGHFLVS